MQNESLVVEKNGSDARPGAVIVEGPDASPGLRNTGGSETSALSCQYKDNSDTKSENCTFKKGYGERFHGGKPVDNSPTSVVACHNKSWTLKLWKKSTPAEQINIPFTCRTWRHEGPCRQFKGAQDFVRIREGLQKHDGWVYIVLTFEDRRGNLDSIYRRIADKFENLRRWISRNYASPGERLQYIALVEQHRDGFPHVNILIHCRRFVDAAAENWRKLRQKVRRRAMGAGFGKVFWLEPVRNEEAISGYFVKLCGEVAKMNQAPMKAPSRFRRLRSSAGLLPPVRKNLDYTGELVKLEVEIVQHQSAYSLLLKEELALVEEHDKERRALKWYESLEMLKDGAIYSPFRLKLFA